MVKHPKFEDHVKTVVHKLRGDLGDILASIKLNAAKPQDMARQLGLNKNLTWKISRIVCEADPYAAIPHIPGKSGFNILVKSLQKAGVNSKVTHQVLNTVREFEQMVELHAGDRATFEMMLGNLTNDGEQQRSEAHRKLSFMGNSATWGVQAHVQLTTNFIAPNPDGDRVDLAWISGLSEFRRLRHDVVWAMASARKAVDDGSLLPLGFIEPIDADYAKKHNVPLMSEHCSDPMPEIKTVSGPESMLRFELLEGPVGNTAAVTCLIGLFGRNFVTRYRNQEPNDTVGEHLARLNTPVEVMIHDLFVHKNLEYAFSPKVAVYSQLAGGPISSMTDRGHELRPVHEKVVELGMGTSGVVIPEMPNYRGLLQSVYDRLDWDAGEFHGFRFRMRYPPIPSLAALYYDLPDA